MITILVIFCQLALSYVHCAPHEPGASSKMSSTDIEAWSLKEVWIKEQADQPPKHYIRQVRLFRNNNAFCLDEISAGTEQPHEERIIIASFKTAELYSLLDDTIYAIQEDPHRVIRMTLANRNEAVLLEKYFQTTTLDRKLAVMKGYGIELLVESVGSSQLKRGDLTLTVLGELKSLGSGSGKRRFVISSDDPRELYAVFNPGDYNFARFTLGDTGTNQFEFVVEPPGGFWGKAFYFVITTRYYDTPNKFDTEMRLHASENIIVPNKHYQPKSDTKN